MVTDGVFEAFDAGQVSHFDGPACAFEDGSDF
jgi:hypothetical protein